MTLLAFLLVVCSAGMHAGWNLICKSRSPSAAFFMIATATSIVCMLPVTIYYLPIAGQLPRVMWPLLVATAFVQAMYYVCLGNAYRLGEVSIAYPLARALPVLFIPVVTTVLSLGERLGVMAVIGMVVVSVGCIILPMPSFRQLSLRQLGGRGFLFILGAAIGTTGYSIIDSEALQIFREAELTSFFMTAVIYIAWENIIIELFLVAYVLMHRRERETLRALFKERHVHYPAMSGVICTSSYTLILAAMMLASNVSYVAAFRQMSIPLGAVLAIIIFKERVSGPKLVGIGGIFVGLLIVGLFS